MCKHCTVYEHLKRLNKGPQQNADGVSLPQQLYESSSSKEPQKAQVEQPVLLDTDKIGSTYPPNIIAQC